jgi:hypothetical protein
VLSIKPTYDTVNFSDIYNDTLTVFQELDSIQRIKWTDKYMPEGLIYWRLYSASIVKEISNNSKVIYTSADDWSKLHLITVDTNQNLIDFVEIGENMSYLIEQSDSYEWYMDVQMLN